MNIEKEVKDIGEYLGTNRDELWSEMSELIKKILGGMPKDKGYYNRVAGGGEYSAGYNDALVDIKKWKDSILKLGQSKEEILTEELTKKFNEFLEEWTGTACGHLSDNDDNDGERFRGAIDEVIKEACKK